MQPQAFSMGLIILPFLAGLFAILPIRLEGQRLFGLAFSLWCLGGFFMSLQGMRFIVNSEASLWEMLAYGLIGLALGFAKARTILKKTALANIDRLMAMSEKVKLIHVYPLRSWIVLTLMLLLGLSLTLFNAPPLLRGMVNLAVGMALLGSSLYYYHAMNQLEAAPSAPAELPAAADDVTE